MDFGDLQNDIYFRGLQGVVPEWPLTAAGLETAAEAAMPTSVWTYVAGGAGDERTQRGNVSAFARRGLVPRMLVGAAHRDLSVDLFGMHLPSPLFLAPVGVLGIAAQDGHGDLATARASAATGVPMIASTLSEDPLEAVRDAAGTTPGMFQLYTPTDRDLAASLVQRAERAGFGALVVTLDTWVTGWRPRDLQIANFPQLRGAALANYLSDPVFRAAVPDAATDPRSVVEHWARVFGNPLTWDDLPWLRSLTDLPIVLKGICAADDARRAVDAGIDGVYVSNHGGRQANGGVPALDLLPDVVSAVGDDVPVLFDSGVRSGSDVVTALAMGASAVGLGRPYVHGLALGGAAGVEHVVRAVLAEADLLMAVNGFPDVAALRSADVRTVDA
jgi:isopentenyl diphosphate isomerase/L-lactate dehydrogenase-like FMN-dependent dehydrogenase